MKKALTLFIFLLALGAGQAFAQKMVIGSKIPEFKGVVWLTPAPVEEVPMLIEFYNPANSTSARYFPKLADIRARYGMAEKLGLQIVVLTPLTGEALRELGQSYGDKYRIGSDPEGKAYQAFNVQFLPYTILVNSKGELYWQGNLGNLPDAVLQKIK